MNIKNYPDSIDLLDFFDSEPVFIDLSSGTYSYQVTDCLGINVTFTFSVVEGWISAEVKIGDKKIQYFIVEGVSEFSIVKDVMAKYISVKTLSIDRECKVELKIKPNIILNISSIIR
ncbi:TPA: hypothetical protein ACGTP8_000892 [Yersinia enterocolitica]|uniref:Uncharacterized protein n=2 Tax=Yersinia massiliensis TaxID=419257 RepID=A0ABM6UTS8_9GAMM|nr:hypothetical protein DA391_12560 [Yersinia massiliensis]